MKKIFTLAGLLFVHGLSSGQNYLSNNVSWLMFQTGCPYNCIYSYDWYFINGDTTIGQKTYYKLYETDLDSTLTAYGNSFVSCDTILNIYRAAIREDSTKKLYIASDTSEMILWDFNLSIGDTLHYMGGGYEECPVDPSVIDSIGTATFGNITRKVFFPKYGHRVYEGIGGYQGLFGDVCCCLVVADEGGNFICYNKDGNEYRFPGDADFPGPQYYEYLPCQQPFTEISSSAIELNEDAGFRLFPNPATNSFDLQLSEPPLKPTRIALYDIVGRLVKQEMIIETNTILQRNNLSNGIYIWQLESSEKVLSRNKIILE